MPPARADHPGPWRTARWLPRVAPLVLILAAAAPPLVFRFLPMTDLPQHAAAVAILQRIGDPASGFAEYYAVDLSRAPYLLPYALALALAPVVGPALAIRAVVSLAIAAYLVGVLLLLRLQGKPWALLLLALPLAYNRAFFWGFVHFQLAVGLALVALALLADPRRGRGRAIALAVTVGALVLTHPYGVLLFLGLAVLWRVAAGPGPLAGRGWIVAAAGAGALVWALAGRSAPAIGGTVSPPLAARLVELPRQLLGGWRDDSEVALLILLGATVALASAPDLPLTPARWRARPALERALWVAILGNLLLYLVVPEATATAKFVHFRHAVIALLLLPVAASLAGAARLPLLVGTLLALTGLGGLANAWAHLRLFDVEARPFGEVVERLPPRPRLAALIFDPDGDVSATAPYLHFAAWAQAERGGVITASFPEIFWNLPLALRPGAPIPPTPPGFEWQPGRYVGSELVRSYDWVLVRGGAEPVAWPAGAPFVPVLLSPPWQLYARPCLASRRSTPP